MTSYRRRKGRIVDELDTHGIITDEYLGEHTHDIEWVTAMSPRILRDMADLVEFCYPDKAYVDVGFLDSDAVNCKAQALVVGRAEDTKHVQAAPRSDGYVDQEPPITRDYLA